MDQFILSEDKKTITGCSTPVVGEIVIPKGIKTIGYRAFLNQTKLEKVTLPEGLRYIHVSAFDGCSSLKCITIPSTVKEIKGGFLAGCFALKKIEVVKENPYYCSSNNSIYTKDKSKLIQLSPLAKTLRLPVKVSIIGNSSCSGCSLEGDLVIKDKIKRIERCAFSENVKLNSVSIPDNTQLISELMFSGCKSLSKIILPNNLTTIDVYMFQDCSSLETIVLPQKLRRIEMFAFANCTNLRPLAIPQTVEVKYGAFKDCTTLMTNKSSE